MGIASDLGYHHPTPNAFQRLLQNVAASPAGAKVFKLTLTHLDNAFLRLSKGRITSAEALAALPVLDITTTGRKSGQPRRTHLIAVPHGDTLALLGTNFGSEHTPTWVLNLEANPRLTAEYRGARADVIARPATEAERADVLQRSESIYPGFRRYLTRISGRTVRIFILQPR